MEAILWAWVVASNLRRIGLISASILLHIFHDFRRYFCHDRATIGSRSGVDRGVSPSSITIRSTSDDFTAKSLRSRLDRAAIAVRSGRDRGVLPHAAGTVRSESNAPPIFTNRASPGLQIGILRSRDMAVGSMKPGRLDGLDCAITWLSDGDRVVLVPTKIGRSRRVHVAKGKPCDPFTYDVFKHVFDLAIAWTRVQAIHALRSVPAGSDARRAATSPTR